jgi:hypothetical protein
LQTEAGSRVGADHFLLPHLGARARILLDRIVASGAEGVDKRDADDWALSRLVDLRYAEESRHDDMVFVCTEAGRRRWQTEILADEQRDATALRRQIIRHRLDERFNRLGLGTSTALTTASSPVEPRLHRGVPALTGSPPRMGMRLTSALAALFAAGAAALVVISASTEPQDVQAWLVPAMPHAAAAHSESSKADTTQAPLVAAPAVATVAAPSANAPATVLSDVTPSPTRQSAAASIDAIVPSGQQGYGGIAFQPGQYVSVPDAVPATVENIGRDRLPVSDAASPVDGAFLIAAAAAAARIDFAVSEGGHIAADLATGVEGDVRSITAGMLGSVLSDGGQIATDIAASVGRGFRSIAASLVRVIVDIDRTVPAPGAAIQQARVEVPAVLPPAAEPPSERGQPAPPEPAIASSAESDRAATVHAVRGERVTAKASPPRAPDATVDPQHAVVERLNLLSLAAARHGQAWRPNGPRDVAETKSLP